MFNVLFFIMITYTHARTSVLTHAYIYIYIYNVYARGITWLYMEDQVTAVLFKFPVDFIIILYRFVFLLARLA